jgi:hypothetical protein
MCTRRVVGGIAALGAAIVTGAAAASPAPDLLSATAHHGRVAVTFTLGEDEVPARILVAVASAQTTSGAFAPASVRIDEPLRATPYRDGFRAVTRHALRPGRYVVEISAEAVGVDCIPYKPCLHSWSNVRRVTIR